MLLFNWLKNAENIPAYSQQDTAFRDVFNLDVSKAYQDTDILSKITFHTLALIRLLLTQNFHQF